MGNIRLLDCTLRDGAYIVDSIFGDNNIKSIIVGLSKAAVDIIECGWLRNEPRKDGSSYFNCVEDVKKLIKKPKNVMFSLMIDYNRYDVKFLEENKDDFIDMIRIAFPMDHIKDGFAISNKIREKGYKVSYQLTKGKDYVPVDYAIKQFNIGILNVMNEDKPICVCLADTFGSMISDDVLNIMRFFDEYLDSDISLGLHMHNNMNLAFASDIAFIKDFENKKRNIVVDSCLLGMGRGAGNTQTELLVDYLNKYHSKKYNLVEVLGLIDEVMLMYKEKYVWGYDPYFAASGMQNAHVNNVSYLKEKHDVKVSELYEVLDRMDAMDKKEYKYDLLENILKGIDK